MLAEAYTAAEKGDMSILHEVTTSQFVLLCSRPKTQPESQPLVSQLQRLFRNPFDEHGPEDEARWYRRTPATSVRKAGVAYFS